MTSLAALATRNFTTVLALILMACAGLGVAADAGLALRLHETADAGDYEDAVLLGFLDCGFRQQVQEGRGLLVGQFELLSQLPRKGGLGQSSCHVFFSFWAPSQGSRCCLGYPPPRRIFPVEEAQDGTAWRECDSEATCAQNPVFMRVFREPCRWLQCDFGRGKVNGKRPISTIFLGFCAYFAYFCLFLAALSRSVGRISCPKTAGKTSSGSMQPEEHLLLRRQSRRDRRIERIDHGRGQLEMANDHGGDVGLKSASLAGSVALSPHWRHWIRSSPG